MRGHALLSHLAALALERGCARVEWCALDWNELALGFYERLGAERLSEWEMHRLQGAALQRVAGGDARRVLVAADTRSDPGTRRPRRGRHSIEKPRRSGAFPLAGL